MEEFVVFPQWGPPCFELKISPFLTTIMRADRLEATCEHRRGSEWNRTQEKAPHHPSSEPSSNRKKLAKALLSQQPARPGPAQRLGKSQQAARPVVSVPSRLALTGWRARSGNPAPGNDSWLGNAGVSTRPTAGLSAQADTVSQQAPGQGVICYFWSALHLL